MSRTFSRRGLFAVAGGAATLVPLRAAPVAAAGPISGPLVTLRSPVRVYDSRTDAVPLGSARLRSGQSVAVTVGAAYADTPSGFALAVFVNCTVTQTEGSGYLVIRGSDLSGEVPLPPTSNINWQSTGQTLANLALTTVGGEHAIEIHCDGGGATHVIVDVLGYVPFTP
jgi:hypothetical protein